MGKIPKPTNGFILLKIKENEIPSGLIIEDKDQIPQRGKVLAIGGDTYYEGGINIFKAPCKVGDTVVHSGFGFEDIYIEGEPFRIIPFSKIIAIL